MISNQLAIHSTNDDGSTLNEITVYIVETVAVEPRSRTVRDKKMEKKFAIILTKKKNRRTV